MCPGAHRTKPIYPANLYLDRKPFDHAQYATEVTERQIALMQDCDIWVPPKR